MSNLSKISAASVIFLTIIISGCAPTIGNKAIKNVAYADLKAGIVVGETTKQDIIDAYGLPNLYETDENGLDQWSYGYAEAGIGSAQSRCFTVRFDGDGKVKAYKFAGAQSNNADNIGLNMD